MNTIMKTVEKNRTCDESRLRLKRAENIVVKVGTSTLTHAGGTLNLRHLEGLCKVLSDLQNSGRHITLVSSGAIGVGMGKTGMAVRPTETAEKQALAAIGQCELMFMYDKFFGEYNHIVAQILLTADVIDNPIGRKNVHNTFDQLFEVGAIPIVNENDTVATEELEGANIGDNDTLSAIVAKFIEADALIILTDIDGLYTGNPQKDADAKRLSHVAGIDEKTIALAGGAGSNLGTGGMVTKLKAAQISTDAGIPCCIISGNDPENLYSLLEGDDIGTIITPGTSDYAVNVE